MERRSEAERINEEAAAWVVRLAASSCTEADRAAFAAWRDGSLRHEAAYERELAAWERLDRLSALGAGERPIDPDLISEAPPRRRHFTSGRLAAGIAVTASLAAVGALVLNAPPAYATGIGERRVVVLKDGSRIELNTDTKVVVRVRGTRREVTLVRGEALFQVTKAEQPFVVVAPQSTLTAQDSELSVRLSDDNAIVSVSRGAVEVDPNNAAAVRLVATVDAVANDSWVRTRARSAEQIRRAQAWREGGVWLDGRSLAETVEEFNRYNERKLVLEDPSIAGLRLGGYFRTDDLGGFVSALTKAFPVVVEARENSYALARRS